MSEVVVVGAGVGGLAAAIACAAEGHAVTVLESAAEAGGKVGRVVCDGLELDTGPSVLTLPEVFDGLLARAGESPLELTRPSRWFGLRFRDGTRVELGNGLQGALDGVGDALGAGRARELASFLDEARAMWSVAGPRFVLGDAPTLRSLIGARVSELRAIRPFETMWDRICAHTADARLRALLARYATYAGSDARRAPAALCTIAWVELGLGGCGVRGGMYRLAERLERAARKLGVRFRFAAPVERILVERGRARGVQAGERVEAEAVICNADVGAVYRALLGLRAPEAGAPSWSGRCALLRVRRSSGPAHEVRFPARYESELDDLLAGREVREPAVYLCWPERAHGVRGWERDEPVFAMINAPAGAEERGFSAPPLPGEVLWERGPAELAERFPFTGGALYGASSHSWRSAFTRPRNRVPEVRGVYLAGGSAHPGAGLPLVAASGLAAARAACADLSKLAVAALLCLGVALPARADRCAEARALTEIVEVQADAAPRADALAARCADGALRAEAAFLRADRATRERGELLARAVRIARVAAEGEPSAARAHLYLGLSLAAHAREAGVFALLSAAGEIRDELTAAARLDAEDAVTQQALCALYHRAPGWPLSFGDDDAAIGHCLHALRLDARAWEAHLVLAELARSRHEDAALREHLSAILDGPLDRRRPLTHMRYRLAARELSR